MKTNSGRGCALAPIIVLCACAKAPADPSTKHERENSAGRCAIYAAVEAPCEIPLAALISHPYDFVGIPISFVGFLAGPGHPGTVFLNREAWRIRDQSSSVVLSLSIEDLVNSKHNARNLKYNYVVVVGSVTKIGQFRQPNIVITPSRISLRHKSVGLNDEEKKLILEEQGSQ